MAEGTSLISVQNSKLYYRVLELEPDRGICVLEDPDTGKRFNWWPGTDRRSSEKIMKQFGFVFGKTPEDVAAEGGDDS